MIIYSHLLSLNNKMVILFLFFYTVIITGFSLSGKHINEKGVAYGKIKRSCAC